MGYRSLDQLHQYEIANGKRLLDVFSLHYYPQGGEFSSDTSTTTQLRRNRSTRSLWDPNYVDETWINTQVQLIPRMKGWLGAYYPGLKTAITEYNWGAEGHINGATTLADILGIFGREGLDMATYWTYPDPSTPTYKAMKMYRNYNSGGAGFGDVSIAATAPNPDNLSAFAATRTSDGALTVMVISKVLSGATPLTLALSGFSGNGTAQAWQLTSGNAMTRLSDLSVNGSLTTSVPPQSVTLFVLPTGTVSTPTVPATPIGLAATPGNTQITLNWTASAGAATYNVYRAMTAGGEGTVPYLKGVYGTTYTNAGLKNGTTYYYQVTAVNAAGESVKSFEVKTTPARR